MTGAPQSDIPSPTNRNATLDVLPRAFPDIDSTSFHIRTDSVLHPFADTAYADDLFSISARHEGHQLIANTVLAFTVIFKIELLAKCRGEEPSHFENTAP